MNNYHINVFFSIDDGGYIADIPDLECCSAFGDTPEKALSEVLIAQKLSLDAAKENKLEIPIPNYKPLIYQVAL